MTKKVILTVSSWLVLVFVLALLFSQETQIVKAGTPLAGFTDEALPGIPAATISSPTDLAFTSDGRILISGQDGEVWVYKNNALLAGTAIDFSTTGFLCTSSEGGLLGITVDSNFPTDNYVYVFLTYKKRSTCNTGDANNGPVNRVSRFTYDLATDKIDFSTQFILVDNIPFFGGNHNAGDLHFGNTGTEVNRLYISTGDAGTSYGNSGFSAGSNTNARRRDLLGGKILRINKDGTIPSDNPYVSTPGSRRCGDVALVPGPVLSNSAPPPTTGYCTETYAWGLRNPFRFNFKAGTNQFYINDVGQSKWEEIDEGALNADYGWNTREGPCAGDDYCSTGSTVPGMTNPIYAYQHSGGSSAASGCYSITGGAFVPPGVFPSSYDNKYIFADYGCQKMFTLDPSSPTDALGFNLTATQFASGEVFIATDFGPPGPPQNQALYYTSFSSGIRRIKYTGTANRSPTAVLNATPTNGASPLTVNFDASSSFDPDSGQTLTYLWDFDGNSTIDDTTTSPTRSFTYNSSGTFTATLRVRDNGSPNLTSAPATKRIDVGNRAPSVTINTPTTAKLFKVGETITLNATATDPEDGVLPASAMTWTVVRVHAQHTHPFVAPTVGNNIQFTAPDPEDLLAAINSSLQIQLTVVDSQGLATTITQPLNPNKITVNFGSAPTGVPLAIGAINLTMPTSVVAWEGQILAVAVGNTFNVSGQTYTFDKWSDNGAATHTILAPGTTATYTVTYKAPNGQPPPRSTLKDYYHQITPVRLYDSRQIAGNTAPIGRDGKFKAGEIRTIKATSSPANLVPFGATSILVNVTISEAEGGGYATAFPADGADTNVPVVNWYGSGGRIVSNFALITLSTAGEFKLKSFNGANVIIDVVGYINNNAADGSVFKALTASNARLYDSRASGTGLLGKGAGVLGVGAADRTVKVAGTGSPQGIPASAKAVVVNVTAANTVKGGYLTLYPADVTAPLASTVNWFDKTAGNIPRDVANMAIVPLSAVGELKVKAGGVAGSSADVLIDVVGYFDSDGAATTGFVSLLSNPQRLYDSRSTEPAYPGSTEKGVLPPLGKRTIKGAGILNVPAGTKAVVVRITTVDVSGGGFLALFPGPTNPGNSNANVNAAGQQIGNLAIVSLNADGFLVLDGSSLNSMGFVLDIFGYIN